MAVTSGTFNFAFPQSVQIIEEAYELAGSKSQEITEQQINAAQRASNFILQHYPNRGLNLWQVKSGMIAINQNQASYSLPLYTIAVLEATLRTSNRMLGGTAFSSAGGIASNAFDGNPQTACTQTAPNGYISYNWGAAQFAISLVGVQSNATLNYTLVFEYTTNGSTWNSVLSLPEQSFPAGQLLWFVIPVPIAGNQFRVRETGGSTLNIQELYFNTTINDTILTPSSRAEYVAYPNKLQPGRPTTFYLDRQINPILYIWPVPTNLYNNIFYTYTYQLQDAGSMLNAIQIPARFLSAFTWELASVLSWKYRKDFGISLDEIQSLKAEAMEKFREASKEDRERVPLRIYGDYLQGWSSVTS